MPTSEIGAAARQQLARVLGSPGFSRNERLSRFLRFVIERHLEGGDSGLKESVIGIEVFGRPPDYNPKQDAIVRNEAGRLRARLGEYYAGQGKDDPLIIELPKGGYVPVIRRTDVRSASHGRSRRQLSLSVVGLAIVILVGLAFLWTQEVVNGRVLKPSGVRRYETSK